VTARVAILVAAFSAATSIVVVAWNGATAHSEPVVDASCSRCHGGSVQRTHDLDFIEREHGVAAWSARAECLGCHARTTCDTCHDDEAPSWHSAAFQNPGRGLGSRVEHGRTARAHRKSCMTCHERRFARACGQCHQRQEWP